MKRKALFLSFLAVFTLAACAQQGTDGPVTPQSTRYQNQPGADPQLAMPRVGERIAIIETDLGVIKMRIFEKDVPELSKNFQQLVRQGKYENVPFHRVKKGFVIQAGDFTKKDGTGGYSYKGPDTFLPNEINAAYHHLYGTVSMAKKDAPVSIGSQFFIVVNQNGESGFDGAYSPIGQVYEGMEVAEAIADLQVPGTEKPSKEVNIKKITLSLYTK